MKNSLLKKIGLGIACAGTVVALNSQDANAQTYNTKGMDKGAKVVSNYRPKSNKKTYVEIKKFANDNVYVMEIDPDKYDDDLDKGALDAKTTTPLTNMQTGKTQYLISDGMYIYRKDSIDFLKPTKACTESYEKYLELLNSNADIKKINLENLLPSQKTFYLGDGTPLIAIEVEDSKMNEEGKMNHYLVPLSNLIEPNGTMHGDFYRPIKEPGKIAVNTETGEVVYKADSTGKKSTFTPEELPKSKPQKANSAYFILGASGNENFAEGNIGLGYGPIAVVGNIGQGKDEVTLEGTTDPSSITGRYVNVKEWNENVNVKGLALEIHPLSNKSISPFVSGGINNWNYTQNKSITMLGGNNQQLGSNSESKVVSENSYKAYAGINFGKGLKFGALAGYDTKTKGYVGARITKNLGAKK